MPDSDIYTAAVSALTAENIPLDASVPVVDDPAPAAEAPPEPPVAEPAAPVVEDTRDPHDKWLEDEEGVKPPVEGQRENRLPHNRVQKISKSAYERGKAEAAKRVEELSKKAEDSERRYAVYAEADRLAGTDPDKFLHVLSTLHPSFQKYLQGAKDKAEALIDASHASNTEADDPKPQKKTFADGSVGYDDEGVEALLQWNRRQTLREANEVFDKRFGAIEKEHHTRKMIEAQIPKVRAQSERVRQLWGADLVAEHDAEIARVIDENPDMDPSDAAAKVLVPILNARVESEKANTVKAREKVLADLNRRPAVAEKREPAAVAAPRTTEIRPGDIVGAARQALIEQGLITA